MTYNWDSTFVLEDALAGTLVGFQIAGKVWDLSETGILKLVGSRYEVYINGYKLRVNKDGKVYECIPANPNYINNKLWMVTAEMGSDGAVGTAITRSSGSSGEGHNNKAVLANIEPRDQFAVQVLNAMLIHTEHPETFDDAKCLMYSRAAYRWAQAMMIAAADSREGQSTTPSTGGVNVNSGDLQSNTEKLLYNIGEYMKNGISVKGTTEVGAAPISTIVTEMPDVSIDSMPNVSIDSMPSVTIDEMPDVTIAEMPEVSVKNILDENDEPVPLEVHQQETTT